MRNSNMMKLAAVGMAFTMAAGLAGCSGSGNGTDVTTKAAESQIQGSEASKETKAPAAGGDNVLKITYSGTPEIHEKQYLMDSFFKKFEEENNCKIEVDFVAQPDAIKKIQSEQETGNMIADVIYADTANMAAYVDGGWMQDITKLVDDMGLTITHMFDQTTNKDGVRYFVPFSFDVYVTAANVKALDYLPEGLTKEDVVSGITWEQYADWSVNIAKGEGKGKTMMPANMTSSQLLYPMGGMSLAYGGTFPEVTSDGFKKAMGIVAKIAEGNGFYAEQDQYTAPTDPLNSGDVWLTFAHMAPIGVSYNAAPNNYVIGAAPKGSNGAGSTSGAWCYGIANGTKNQELAELFIQYATSPEVNYDFCSNYGGSLSPIAEVGEILESSDVVMRAGIEMLETTTVTGVPASDYSDWNAVKLLFGDVFNETIKNKAVPSDDFLATVQGKLEALKK